jgi:DNA-binding NtrC family response regulator
MMQAEPCSVLLVDDETAFIEPLVKRLNKRGLTTAGCHSGEEALRHLASGTVDVVVLDVKMPGLGGIETLREIKREHPLVEVIMLTGHASVEAAIEGMELGAFDYLMKPTDLEDLLFKIQDAHQKKAIQEAKIEKMKKSTD